MYNTLNTFAAGGGEYVKLTSQTSWPGVDPMNAEYAAGPAARVAYYGVSGVPDCSLNGGATEGPTTAVTAAKLATKAAEMTPYSIAVSHTWGSAGELIVNVDITNTTVDPVSTHDKLYIAMVEDQISFPTAPGSNGETDFYYVMRQFYDASGASGGLFSNGPNNMAPEVIGKLNTTSVPAPMSEGMESAPLITGEGYSRTLSTAIFDAGDITVGNFAIVDGPTVGEGTIGGFGWSNRSILFNYYNLQSGTMSLVLHKLNLEANSALIFNTAYCQYSGENDKLEVEVSTNCGTSWNSVFMESGTTLAHGLAAQSGFYIPNTSGSGWYEHTVDLSDYDNTNDVIVRFKGIR